MHRVLRWDVPVDDAWHDIGAGDVVHVAARSHRERPGDLVEVWTLEDLSNTYAETVPQRSVTVFGTGHPLPDDVYHIGTTVVPTFSVISGPTRGTVERVETVAGLVWHVFAKHDPEAERQALAEQGRRLASIREDLIAQGVDPGELPVPLHPGPAATLGQHVNGIVRGVKVETLEDEATSLAYWLANELGEHVDDQDGETLTDTVRRLLAIKLAPPDAPAVPITDWDDFRVGDVVVQNPALIDADVTHDMAGRNDAEPFLVRRPGSALDVDEPQIGGFKRGHIVTIGSNGDQHEGATGVVATLDHDHGWRLWVRVGADVYDQHAPALYLSPDDIDMVVVP